jgi:hypothetical protein
LINRVALSVSWLGAMAGTAAAQNW